MLNATTKRGPDGSIIGVIGVGQFKELQEASTQYQVADDLTRLIETANAPIFGINVDGHVTEWNLRAGKISGYSEEETLGKLVSSRTTYCSTVVWSIEVLVCCSRYVNNTTM